MKLDEALERIVTEIDDNFLQFPCYVTRRVARLFHYPTQTGLLGIVETCQVRATNLLYLNDASELRHGFSLASDIFRSLRSERALVCS